MMEDRTGHSVQDAELSPVKFKLSAFDTFLKFVDYDKGGQCISTGRIFGKGCYKSWLESRSRTPKAPEESFRRALISHLTGSEGRKPFPPDVEKLLLRDIRRKETWKCFENLNDINIGSQGFKKLGFHERKQREKMKICHSSDEDLHSVPDFKSGSTSLSVFLSFVKDRVDASEIISKACFDSWLAARICRPSNPEESFRRSLISHLTASDGRKAFPPSVEADLLHHIRKKQIWPCFRGTNSKIGLRGFQKMGYHEKRGLGEDLPNIKAEHDVSNKGILVDVKVKHKDYHHVECSRDRTSTKIEPKDSIDIFVCKVKKEGIENPIPISHYSDHANESCSSSMVDSCGTSDSDCKSRTDDSWSDSVSVSSTELMTVTRKRNIRDVAHAEAKARYASLLQSCINGSDDSLLQNLAFYGSNELDEQPRKLHKYTDRPDNVKQETKWKKDFDYHCAESNPTCLTSAQEFVRTLMEFHQGPRNLYQFLKLQKDQGQQLLTPSLYYMLNQNPGNELYYQREFLFPIEEDRHFRRDRPVGKLVIDKDFMIRHMTLTGANILGGPSSLQVQNWLIFSGSRVQCALLIMNMFPVLYRNPEGFPLWFRKCIRCVDGSIRVVMVRIKFFASRGLFEVALQDISDLERFQSSGMGKKVLLSFD